MWISENTGTYDKADLQWDSFVEELKQVLSSWRHSNQPSGHPSWNKSVKIFKFADCGFSLTRHWIPEISEERESGNADDQGDKKKTLEIPKAWMDMKDKSNWFPSDDAYSLHRYYGLKDFIVLESDFRYFANFDFHPGPLLQKLSSAASEIDWLVPLFVKIGLNTYVGVLKWCGFRTSFKMSYERCVRDLDSYDLNYLCDEIISYLDIQMEDPASISARLTYKFDEPSDYPGKLGVAVSTNDFGGNKFRFSKYDDNGNPFNEFELCATWLDPVEYEVNDSRSNIDLDPLDAAEWSVKVKVADTSYVPLGGCLKMFLSLCTSKNVSLLSIPQLSSTLKPGRINKQREEVNESLAMQGLIEPKVRKVTSKLILEPEESVIPVESLNDILDFLFSDAKLQPPQCSNGSNPSTITVEDEVEDKFFLSYKELSDYFKSAQSASLTGRLAICLCIVNKYHGGIRAVNQLWGEFFLEIKYCMENNCEIKGLEPSSNLDYTELLQQLQQSSLSLQTLNSFIKKKKARQSSENLMVGFATEKNEILFWLILVKTSDLVFGFMPVLIHSTVTRLVKLTQIKLPFLNVHLKEIQNKVEELGSLGAPKYYSSSDWIQKFKDLIDLLTFVEERMAKAQYLSKRFRQVDPSHTVDDFELQKFVCKLVEFGEASILRSSTELPSNTKLGRITHKFFLNGCKQVREVAKESNPDAGATLDQVDKLSKPTGWEYILRFSSSSSAPMSDLQQFHCNCSSYAVGWAAASTLNTQRKTV